jgi:hypothetical protein
MNAVHPYVALLEAKLVASEREREEALEEREAALCLAAALTRKLNRIKEEVV